MYFKTVAVLLVCSFVVNSSCRNSNTSELNAVRAMNESLDRARQTIYYSTQTIDQSFQERLREPSSRELSEAWYPKLLRVREHTRDALVKIENIKLKILNAAGLKTQDNGGAVFREHDRNAVVQIIKNEGYGKALYLSIKRLRDSLLVVDSLIMDRFSKLTFFPTSFDTSNKPAQFVQRFFENVSAIVAIGVLNQFQNNIQVAENLVAAFCHEQTVRTRLGPCMSERAIIVQSSNVLSPGEQLEITAGIGVFKMAIDLKVKMGKKEIALTDDALAVYKFKSPKIPGVYKLPVWISFTDQDGRPMEMSETISYTVK